jgi:hypothetical protein
MFPWVIGGNTFACIMFAIMAIISPPGWLPIVDAFMVGACLSAVIHTIMMERLGQQLRILGEICGILHGSNLGLISKLEERDREPPSSPDDVPGLRPRLH